MQKVCIIGAVCAFFKAVVTRIICIIRVRYVQFCGHIRGGVFYWRGRVFTGCVAEQRIRWRYFKKYCGKHGLAFREVPAALRLLVGLPAHAKRGGAAGGAGVAGGKGVEKVLHGGLPVQRARRVVVVNPSWRRFEIPTALRQRVVDGAAKGQSVSFMPL